ncbi:hypothetical protein Cadr_000001893 [Camelus dromedarius]|uniref:Uncharacterized protein n=1 Tax=Camelus dromedarius TaxID=9838 RepID=A0A5N4EHG1_CAMDR|nr:hypothetical protein Cadr_000001893 [Camelus dromedarius]
MSTLVLRLGHREGAMGATGATTGTEVKSRVPLWVFCFCVVIALTAERLSFMLPTMSDVNFHGNNHQPCSKLQQCQAWVLHCARHHYSGPLFYGLNPKYAAFMMSKRM